MVPSHTEEIEKIITWKNVRKILKNKKRTMYFSVGCFKIK
jgi:hypothetical protein